MEWRACPFTTQLTVSAFAFADFNRGYRPWRTLKFNLYVPFYVPFLQPASKKGSLVCLGYRASEKKWGKDTFPYHILLARAGGSHATPNKPACLQATKPASLFWVKKSRQVFPIHSHIYTNEKPLPFLKTIESTFLHLNPLFYIWYLYIVKSCLLPNYPTAAKLLVCSTFTFNSPRASKTSSSVVRHKNRRII